MKSPVLLMYLCFPSSTAARSTLDGEVQLLLWAGITLSTIPIELDEEVRFKTQITINLFYIFFCAFPKFQKRKTHYFGKT